MNVRLLNRLAAVEQHVSAWGLHTLILHLSDRCVIKMVPGPSHSTVAQSRVVTHVQITCVILEKAQRRWLFHLYISIKQMCCGFSISVFIDYNFLSCSADILEIVLITLMSSCIYSPPQRTGCMRNTRSSALVWTGTDWGWASWRKEH